MQNGEETPVAAETAPTLPEEITKQSFRLKIWRHLETNGLAMFPRPVYNRIPNFKGAAEAAAKLAELDVFKNANIIKVNPDKPQEPVRVICLEKHKTLYVPVPRLQNGFLNRLELPEGETRPASIRKAVSRNGMETFGQPLSIEDSVSLDLVVMGSVAVSKEGYRIGKGKGYGDLEFGLMMHMKAIKPNTLVATTVHDCQVFDTLPAELFGPHDVPIDLIITPTQVIETQRMSQRPVGILWHLLSNRRIQLMPVLGQLRDIEMLAGRACSLKEDDTDVEERAGAARRRTRRRTRSHKSHSEGEGNTTEGEEGKLFKPRRSQRRRNSNKSVSKDEKEGKEGKEDKPRRPRRPKPVIDFSVKISNISPNTRVRDLKQALSERGVKPQVMIWKGFRGFCYLHFFKPGPQKGEGDSVPAANMESVLAALSQMSVGGSGGGPDEPRDDKPRLLCVEPAPPRNAPAPPTVPEVSRPLCVEPAPPTVPEVSRPLCVEPAPPTVPEVSRPLCVEPAPPTVPEVH
ncbi:methenyltetrahydrofolate synthase domain-containing protein isoform X5 [Nymphalis io]|uniref:methenyltetrahydrofolate synthase domain-containing protein isoform X2 n=1 Tax=Inachis io TaxID=171585 RepID=UPI0021686C0B|nr:methenyltetrahydrofolate synthase domain-containing protein isoform X2 [Nymphalis io]XP_050357531.1 methenyltetrahydrofolate synthase domain-containing protein isoform X3 [Nymphalis io]XP_050357533.1 methenyltetrahydrofolate synthase domain-containing protein isoform X4 [Nymphalis io]XP_050357534.1 methenyltetrahydrofolate synthase domain-containing protein isoform X5 [Nymphalis io]